MGRVALDGSAASNFPGRFAYKKETMNTFIHNLPLSSLRWKALYFQLSGNLLYWQISLSLVCPLRNHVILSPSHQSQTAVIVNKVYYKASKLSVTVVFTEQELFTDYTELWVYFFRFYTGSRQAPAVPLHSSTRNAPANGKPYQYSKIEV